MQPKKQPKKLSISLVMAPAMVALAACGSPATRDGSAGSAPAASAAATDATPKETAMALTSDTTGCPVTDSRNWTAWINRMPGPDARAMLHVTGDVEMPTPGWTFAWREGIADRSAVPSVRIHLEATPPGGMSAQVLTSETVKFEAPALAEAYRRIIVMCGDVQIAEISEIETVY